MDRAAGNRAKEFRIKVAGKDSGRQFANEIGIAYGTWNGIENGSPMSTRVWLKIGRKWPGMAHDWFRYGERRGLSGAMIELLYGLPNRSRRQLQLYDLARPSPGCLHKPFCVAEHHDGCNLIVWKHFVDCGGKLLERDFIHCGYPSPGGVLRA